MFYNFNYVKLQNKNEQPPLGKASWQPLVT